MSVFGCYSARLGAPVFFISHRFNLAVWKTMRWKSENVRRWRYYHEFLCTSEHRKISIAENFSMLSFKFFELKIGSVVIMCVLQEHVNWLKLLISEYHELFHQQLPGKCLNFHSANQIRDNGNMKRSTCVELFSFYCRIVLSWIDTFSERALGSLFCELDTLMGVPSEAVVHAIILLVLSQGCHESISWQVVSATCYV